MDAKINSVESLHEALLESIVKSVQRDWKQIPVTQEAVTEMASNYVRRLYEEGVLPDPYEIEVTADNDTKTFHVIMTKKFPIIHDELRLEE